MSPSHDDVSRQEFEDLKKALAVQVATQAGEQATQAAVQAGAEATQAAVQAGQASTTAAAQAGLTATVAAGAAGMIIGLSRDRDRQEGIAPEW